MIFIGDKATGIASNMWFIAFIHNWSDANFQIEDGENTDVTFPCSSPCSSWILSTELFGGVVYGPKLTPTAKAVTVFTGAVWEIRHCCALVIYQWLVSLETKCWAKCAMLSNFIMHTWGTCLLFDTFKGTRPPRDPWYWYRDVPLGQTSPYWFLVASLGGLMCENVQPQIFHTVLGSLCQSWLCFQ